MKLKNFFGVVALTVILAMFTVMSLTGCGNDDPAGDGNGDGNGDDGGTQNSGDGTSWTVGANGYTGKCVVGIAYGNGKFVAGGYPNEMSYSPDGITWTAVNSVPTGNSKATIKIIAYGGGTFVTCAESGTNAIYSTDGITWRPTNNAVVGTDLLGKSNSVGAIAYGDNKFVAVGSKYTSYSSDGITWTTTPINKSSKSGFGLLTDAIVYDGSKFVAVGGALDDDINIWYSYDGITWTDVSTDAFDYISNGKTQKGCFNKIAYGNGKFVAGGSKGKLATSTDGITWTPLPDNTFGIYADYYTPIYGIAYGNGKFVVVGTDIGSDPLISKIICIPD